MRQQNWYGEQAKLNRIRFKFIGIILAVLAVFLLVMVNVPEKEKEPADVVYELYNVWVMETDNGVLRYFYQNEEKQMPYDGTRMVREQVADIVVRNDRAETILSKEEKITGKLLNIASEGITLEGKGTFPIGENFQAYQIYGITKTLDKSQLRIGYSDTDYILEDGKITACLVARDEAMEKIRVLLKSSDFTSFFHDKVVLSSDNSCRIIQEKEAVQDDLEEGSANRMEILEAGETFELTMESEWFKNSGRIRIESDTLTGKIKAPSIGRSQGVPEYRGSLEIMKTEHGFVIVNEILLEEYLYAVVPSEMPASYPMEALKAQAVCARTYAYGKMLYAGLPEYGAHVDDSTNFQVYNNIIEHTNTTEAVKATKGEILYYGEEPVQAYYYSTSCGHGTTPDVWADGQAEKLPYLSGRDMEGLEQEEAWYRWTYEVESVSEEILLARLQERYALNPAHVLTLQKNGEYESVPIEGLGAIRDIRIEKQGDGGIIDELVIEGEQNTVKVRKELTIRHVLNNGISKVLRQDGEAIEMKTLLPSAFFTIETSKEKEIVIGYRLSGGGYGHGVGMSQNGAKAMANQNQTAGDILEFFYEDSRIVTVY